MKKVLICLIAFFAVVSVFSFSPLTTHTVHACQDCDPPPPSNDPPPSSGPIADDGAVRQEINACLARPAPPCTLEEQIGIVVGVYSVHGITNIVHNADGSITYFCANLRFITISGPHACGIACSSNSECTNVVSGCNFCVSGTCQNTPPTPTNTPVPAACGNACNTKTDCSTAKPGCQDCVDKGDGNGKVCGQAACGVKCSTPADCQGAKDSCTACVDGVCKTPPVCGDDCTNNPSLCTQNVTGCNSCLPDKTASASAGKKTCQPPALCGADCTTHPDICQTVKNVPGCNNCLVNQASGAPAGQKTCQSPPVCGADCGKDPSVCSQIAGCTQCVTQASGAKKCMPQVTCGTDCTNDPGICKQANGGCNTCFKNKCSVDLFNPAMCKCDGTDTDTQGNIVLSGQKVTITGFAKVMGGDTDWAKIKDMTFGLFDGSGKELAVSDPVPAVLVSQTAEKTVYKGTWTTILPQNVVPGAVYTVTVNTNCQRQQLAVIFSEKTLAQARAKTQVLGAATAYQAPIQHIVTYLKSILGIKDKTVLSDQTQLQLDSFRRGTVEKSCHSVLFKF